DIDRVRSNTVSGGLCINEVILHVVQHDLPFGGVGHSGTGAYHGKAGFERLSHMKPVFVQTKLNGMNFLLPPYGGFFKKAMGMFLK
ncbi:aldehyde dehydrogenase family protein, partial [Psychrobacter sp. T6-1]